MTLHSTGRRKQRGYSLVEVLIATAILGILLLSIVTLFFIGQRNVYSGKQLTAANAVVTRVLEDLALMSATDVLLNFNLTDSSALTSNTLNGVTYADSLLLDTNGTINSTTDPSGYLGRWKALVPAATFKKGRFVLVVMPRRPLDENKKISTAQVVRLRGVVLWNESVRTRSVTFDTSKVQRP
ncbi:MAG: type II secretion system GspH family protein [Acidobacteriota bacterium]|nr:type II secretion system GspH family protein [Acidobacteriota bacterium]